MHQLPPKEEWVDLFGDALYAYALKFVPNPEEAQNLVQETFLAALTSKNSFKGVANPKTWFIGILKNKITDYLRLKYRETPASQLAGPEIPIEQFFDQANGHLKKEPKEWALNPALLLENAEFWHTFNGCLGKLPEKEAHAFALREIEAKPSEEICKVLNISATNLWVLLHRGRLQLRQCLEINWFSHD